MFNLDIYSPTFWKDYAQLATSGAGGAVTTPWKICRKFIAGGIVGPGTSVYYDLTQSDPDVTSTTSNPTDPPQSMLIGNLYILAEVINYPAVNTGYAFASEFYFRDGTPGEAKMLYVPLFQFYPTSPPIIVDPIQPRPVQLLDTSITWLHLTVGAIDTQVDFHVKFDGVKLSW